MKSAKWWAMGLAAFSLCVAGQGVPPGFDAGSFTRLGFGGRALGMGGAYVAVAEGTIAGYWNPAGLARLAQLQVEGLYTDWLGAGIFLQYLTVGGAPPIGENRWALRIGGRALTFGLTWASVRVADIPWDEDGVQSTFDAWSHLWLASVAVPVSEDHGLDLGASVKVYHDRILEGSSFGMGVDVGLLWRTAVREIPVSLGVCAVDLGGSQIQWFGTTGEPVNHVPWLMRGGASATFPIWEAVLLCTASYEWGVDRPRFERARVGIEARLAMVSVRAGWEQPFNEDPGRWTAGAGVSILEWGAVEYAFIPGRLGDSHLVALRLKW